MFQRRWWPTPLMLAVAVSVSIAASIPLTPLLGVPWAGLAGGLIGGGAGAIYQAMRKEPAKLTARPAQCCELCPCTGAQDQEACSPCCACGRES
jgi:hypothetical protein